MIHNSEQRVLAIDYGTKRVGIALSDPLCLFPSITITLTNNSNLIPELLKIISEKKVKKIIVGFPYARSSSTSEIAKSIEKFKTELELKSALSIELWDEHMTSKMAESRIINTVVKKSKRRDKSLIDAQSAAIMLEEYLNSLEKK